MAKYLGETGLAALIEKIKTLLGDKVDKVTGKGLSTNDYTNAEKTKLAGLSQTTVVNNLTSTSETSALSAKQGKTLADSKVDKVTGKGLSTNDYTNAEKEKLEGFSNSEEYALKTDIEGVYRFKGYVDTYENLPEEDQVYGDVYKVESDNTNYVWVGNTWDTIGTTIDIESITPFVVGAAIDRTESYDTIQFNYDVNDLLVVSFDRSYADIVAAINAGIKVTAQVQSIFETANFALFESQVARYSAATGRVRFEFYSPTISSKLMRGCTMLYLDIYSDHTAVTVDVDDGLDVGLLDYGRPVPIYVSISTGQSGYASANIMSLHNYLTFDYLFNNYKTSSGMNFTRYPLIIGRIRESSNAYTHLLGKSIRANTENNVDYITIEFVNGFKIRFTKDIFDNTAFCEILSQPTDNLIGDIQTALTELLGGASA